MRKKNVRPHNENDKKYGYCEVYYTNDSIAFKGFYYNGKKVGYSEWNRYDNNELDYKKYHI